MMLSKVEKIGQPWLRAGKQQRNVLFKENQIPERDVRPEKIALRFKRKDSDSKSDCNQTQSNHESLESKQTVNKISQKRVRCQVNWQSENHYLNTALKNFAKIHTKN